MNLYIKSRQTHGDLYRIKLGIKSVTYRLLTWKEFNMYNDLLETGVLPAVSIKDAIFKCCVLDTAVKTNIDSLLAGEVLTVVDLILVQSGPYSIESIDAKLEEKRRNAATINSQIIAMICQAFPAYTPDDIDKMNWDRIMEIFAMAEAMMLDTGKITEPVSLTGKKKRQTNNNIPFDPTKENIDLEKALRKL